RPRNQGASLTTWELGRHGVPHTLVADNAGGHLMQTGEVDLCLVGTDRTTRNGDVANKIGTYLKALAAADNNVPFYVALPGSTIDWATERGSDIPIEERASEEITHISGRTEAGDVTRVALCPDRTPAANPAFDITPAQLVTDRGVCDPTADALAGLYPERVE
ncbi:MAG: S-methyl-5-thioribose-1-phosphate isomerase, partial [Thiohalorhabdaceae bacterium]